MPGRAQSMYHPMCESGVGAVAQLGERRVRNAKVGSSILLGSTISLPWVLLCPLLGPRRLDPLNSFNKFEIREG